MTTFHRPRLKRVHVPYRVAGPALRIGGAYGVGVEIWDPDELIWTLIGAMDGTRTREQVAAAVRERYPQHDQPALLGAIDQLVQTGFFDDADAPVPVCPADQDRYSRSVAYYAHVDRTPRPSSWDIQAAIAGAHVVVLGLGGLGGACAYALAASGIGRLTLVDHDRVEESNLNRQILYGRSDLGRPKVEAAAGRLTDLREDLVLDARQEAVRDEADLDALFRCGDLVVLAADTPVRIEEWANRAALRSATPWVNGSYDGPHVSATLYTPGTGPCWRCLRLAWYAQTGESTVEREVHMATAATANLAGNLTAHIALAQLTGVHPPRPGEPVVWSTVRLGHAFTTPVPRRPDCPECGDGA
jgi:molybdopterin/thiamine biosynthesis adenylyltransferase